MKWLSDNALERLRAATELPDLSATKYRIIEKHASGGMGAIYVAEDTALHRKVAVKVMHALGNAGEQAERILREARIVAQLEHPSIVPVHDVGELPDGRIFYVMKLVQGSRLDQHAHSVRSLPDLLRVFQKVCEAVAFAHAHGVLHRDLKPENILVGAFGEVLVMDWGLAKLLPDEASAMKNIASAESNHRNENGQYSVSASPETLHGTIMGTPAYMSPEQANGEIHLIDQRSDVFALGAILRFLLQVAHSPRTFPLTSVEKADTLQRVYGRLFTQRKTPKSLLAICSKAMSEDRNGRYASALDLAKDVERFLNGLSVSSYKENVFEKSWRWLKQYRFVIFLVLMYFVARVLLYIWFRP